EVIVDLPRGMMQSFSAAEAEFLRLGEGAGFEILLDGLDLSQARSFSIGPKENAQKLRSRSLAALTSASPPVLYTNRVGRRRSREAAENAPRPALAKACGPAS